MREDEKVLKMMSEIPPKFGKRYEPSDQQTEKTPNKKNPKKFMTKPNTVQLLKTKDEKKMFFF